MRSIVLTRFGEPAEVLELKTLPEPSPPGPSEVVIPVTKRVIHPAPRPDLRGFSSPLTDERSSGRVSIWSWEFGAD